MIREVRTKMATLMMALIVALLTGSAALAQDVSTNSMPGTDFTKYHTYKWITIEGAKYPNQIVDAQIKTSIDSQLARKRLNQDRWRQSRPLHWIPTFHRPGKAMERLRHWRFALGRRNGERYHVQDKCGDACAGYV